MYLYRDYLEAKVYTILVHGALLGGSWVVKSGEISPLVWVITIVTLLITPLITAGFRDRSGFQRALTPAEQCPSGRRRQGVQRVQGLGRGGVIVFGG